MKTPTNAHARRVERRAAEREQAKQAGLLNGYAMLSLTQAHAREILKAQPAPEKAGE